MDISKNKQELILTQVLHDFASCEDNHATMIERSNKSYLYYTGQLPEATNIDNYLVGDYVEPVLSYYTQQRLVQILDSFTEDDKLAVTFRPTGAISNPVLNEIITSTANKVFLRLNSGYEILETLIKDILITGDSYGKTYIDHKTLTDKATSKDWVEVSELYNLLGNGWDIDFPDDFQNTKRGKKGGFEWKKTTQQTIDPQTGQKVENEIWFVKGKIPLVKEVHDPKVEPVEVSDLWIDTSHGQDWSKLTYIAHRLKMTVGEAKLRGYDPEKLVRAAQEKDEDPLPELYFSDPFASYGNQLKNQSTDPDQKEIDIIEHYTFSSQIEGETRCYQVTTTRADFLKIEEIDHIPFVHGQMETLLGSYYGRSMYDLAKPYQDQLSFMQRLSLHTAKASAFPGYFALKGQYERADMLQNTRPGAIVEVKQMGAVERFERLQLPDGFYKAMDDLRQSADNVLSTRNGATDFSNGVDRTSAKTVALGMYQEGLDGNTISKNIARTLISPLYSLILKMILTGLIPLEGPDGQPVDVSLLPSEGEFIVDINTSADDLAQVNQIGQMTQFAIAVSQANMPYISQQNIYEMLKLMCKRMDLDPNTFLTDPQTVADPHAAAEQAEQAAIISEISKIKLEREKAGLRKDTAEVYHLEAQTDELIRDGDNKRSISYQESLTNQAKVLADKSTKDAATAVKAHEVDVKSKAVDFEAMLGAAKHATDITSPQINGVR